MRLGNALFATILTVLCGSQGMAGSWISSGGHIDQDRNNPWFFSLQPLPFSTQEPVRYCLSYDGQRFSAPLDQIRSDIKKSLQFWREQFASNGGALLIASETFVEVACARDNVDLTFQFGTLNREQRSFIGTPQDYVSVAIRTEYDEEAMRGRGFIYFSTDEALKAATRSEYELPWKEDSVLFGVLVHELGHVFGLQHTDDDGIMSPDFPRKIVEGSIFADNDLQMTRKVGYFKTTPKKYFSVNRYETNRGCMSHPPEARNRFFGIPLGFGCFAETPTPDGTGLEIKGKARLEDPWITYGTIRITDEAPFKEEKKDGVHVFFPSRQRKYPSWPGPNVGASWHFRSTQKYYADFESSNKLIKRSMVFKLGPGGFSYDGVLDGKIIEDL
ncbi:MAG: matrixin family metalloprotease [Oligoflexales bacterium]